MRLPIQVEAIIYRKVNNNIEYLLIKRIPERYGFWQYVTGGLNEGETKIEGLKREIAEEVGIEDIKTIIEDVHYYEYDDEDFSPGKLTHMKAYDFGVEVEPDVKVILDKNHEAYKWCSFEKALKLLKWDDNKNGISKLNSIFCKESQA